MVTLNQNLYAFEAYGLVDPLSLLGPVRQSTVKNGDGLFCEEATVNLLLNPSFEVDATNWVLNTTASASGGRSTVRAFIGSASYQITETAATATDGYVQSSNMSVSTGSLTLSAWVYITSNGATFANRDMILIPGTATITGTGVGTYDRSKLNQWQRVTTTVTVTGAGTISARFYSPASGSIYVDAVQLEAKAYPTSYCDGARATAWNASGAQQTWDFEDGTTASWGTSNCTIANSTTAPYQGTKALRATATGITANPTSPQGVSAAAASPGKTYTVTAWVRASAARQGRLEILWWNGASLLTSVAATNVTMTAGVYIRLSVTGVAPANTTGISMGFRSTDSVNADTFDIDAVRIEKGTGSAAYFWNGTENAASSSRQATSLVYPITPLNTAITIAGLVRISTAAVTSGSFATPIMLGSTTDGFQVYIAGTTGTVNCNKFVGGVTTSVTSSLAVVAGDLLFFCLRFDGANLKISAGKNGGTVSHFTTATSTVPGAISQASIGMGNGTGTAINAAAEDLMVFNRVLADSEVAALGAYLMTTSEVDYGDTTFTGIILLAGADTARGTVQALSKSGAGLVRAGTAIPCFMEIITPEGSNPEDDAATAKFTVAAGAGIGEGQLVSLSPVGGVQYTVKRVFSPGNTYDELYVA